MKVLITGAGGQLGKTFLSLKAPGFFFTAAPSFRNYGYRPLPVRDFDAVINCAAWNDLPGAERNPMETFRLNTTVPAVLAGDCREHGTRFVTYSTDYVFDGKMRTPYTPDDAPGPVNVYGASKLAGELAVKDVNPDALVIRTACLYSPHGKNLVKTVLGKLAERAPFIMDNWLVTNVTDAESLAWYTLHCLRTGTRGVRHFVSSPPLTRFDAAKVIEETAGFPGLVRPGPYFDGVNRPLYTALDSLYADSWRDRIAGTVRAVLGNAVTGVP